MCCPVSSEVMVIGPPLSPWQASMVRSSALAVIPFPAHTISEVMLTSFVLFHPDSSLHTFKGTMGISILISVSGGFLGLTSDVLPQPATVAVRLSRSRPERYQWRFKGPDKNLRIIILSIGKQAGRMNRLKTTLLAKWIRPMSFSKVLGLKSSWMIVFKIMKYSSLTDRLLVSCLPRTT